MNGVLWTKPNFHILNKTKILQQSENTVGPILYMPCAKIILNTSGPSTEKKKKKVLPCTLKSFKVMGITWSYIIKHLLQLMSRKKKIHEAAFSVRLFIINFRLTFNEDQYHKSINAKTNNIPNRDWVLVNIMLCL